MSWANRSQTPRDSNAAKVLCFAALQLREYCQPFVHLAHKLCRGGFQSARVWFCVAYAFSDLSFMLHAAATAVSLSVVTCDMPCRAVF